MLYQELIQQLYSINLFSGMKLGLNNSLKLQRILNFPDHKFKTIHVAGTNGKGSVTTKIAKGIQSAGYRVGLYTSPHISCFRERISINGEMISEKSIEEILPTIFEVIKNHSISATFFEIATVLALIHFANQKVDFVILETGLGGRFDATNIVNPILSVITSISLDHTEYLGHTIEEIAKEKAGIIKDNIPVVIGPKTPYDIIKIFADDKKSPLFQVAGEYPTFEEENCMIAKTALKHLSVKYKISDQDITNGLKARQPCRFQVLTNPCTIILDVAHNPDGLSHLFQAVQHHFGNRSIRILFGLSKNKDIGECVKIIREFGNEFHLVQANNGRGELVSNLEEKMKQQNVTSDKIFVDECIKSSLDKAIKAAQQHDQILVICGSFFIMSEVRRCLGLLEPRDEFDMNEKIVQATTMKTIN
ncbi:MAG: bifunctional folylpolyglutamate synthase/dihydrofolate synthase [Parachlamydiaceae bacterium]|nr:bifunctional folylpolyglutamate synthase/dihydrofolate synthase [Parachlamydiaceae bacterium]